MFLIGAEDFALKSVDLREMTMILCSSCQHELPDNSRFCGYCGSKVEDPSPAPASTGGEGNQKTEPISQTKYGLTPAVRESDTIEATNTESSTDSVAESVIDALSDFLII